MKKIISDPFTFVDSCAIGSVFAYPFVQQV
jgi:hypothetical protein